MKNINTNDHLQNHHHHSLLHHYCNHHIITLDFVFAASSADLCTNLWYNISPTSCDNDDDDDAGGEDDAIMMTMVMNIDDDDDDSDYDSNYDEIMMVKMLQWLQ